MTRINKQKATSLLEQARLHLSLGQNEKVEQILKQVAYESDLQHSAAFAVLAEAQSNAGRFADAEKTLRDGLQRFPDDPDLLARLANAVWQQDRVEEALDLFGRVKGKLAKDASFLTQYALALVRAGRIEDAEKALATAIGSGGGHQAMLVQAVARGRAGRYAEAEKIARQVEAGAKSPKLSAAARAVRADCRLFLGDAEGALALFKELRAAKWLDSAQLGHMAYAAQLASEADLADELMRERIENGPTAEDLLLFAQIANLRNQPHLALSHLERSSSAGGERHWGYAFEVMATKGRSLRLLGRRDEARAVLLEAASLPEFRSGRLAPKVHIDLGHLCAEEGDFDKAAEHFKAALEADPGDPEARYAMELTARKVAWRTELEASAEARVESARAEAEAMRRRFLVREGEIEQLRKELERVKKAQREAEERAQRTAEEAYAAVQRARAEQEALVREELSNREQEIEAKAKENVERALSPDSPGAVQKLLLVAERTYQTALYTELPAAAVAVLFSGALERALFVFFVERFDEWLSAKDRRGLFLAGAVRQKRGRHVEYFDHFVEAFDRDKAAKAPSMGEVGRVLARRREPYLEAFKAFLDERYALPDGFYDRVADFVAWAKERLRDPVAHGRDLEVGYDELKRFREQLMFSFGGADKGLLRQLAESDRAGGVK